MSARRCRASSAARNGHAMVVVVLLNEGVEINENTGAALMLAARQGHLNIVNMLLAKGAKVSLAVEGGYTPLCVATRNGHAAVTAALLRAGAEADEEAGPVGMTLYMNASVDAPNATSQGDLVSAPSSGNEGGDEMGNESSSDLNTKHETNSDSDANADGKQRSDADGDGVLGTAWSTGNGSQPVTQQITLQLPCTPATKLSRRWDFHLSITSGTKRDAPGRVTSRRHTRTRLSGFWHLRCWDCLSARLCC